MSDITAKIVLVGLLFIIGAGSAYAARVIGKISEHEATASVLPATSSPSSNALRNLAHVVSKPLAGVAQTFALAQSSKNTGVTETSAVSEVSLNSSSENVLSVKPGVQPNASVAPAGAGGVAFTIFTLSAGSEDVEVRTITIARVGAGQNGAFDSIAIEGEGFEDEKRLNSNSQIIFDGPFTVQKGTTQTFTLFGNMAEDTAAFAGQMPQLAIVAIEASAKVQGSLPIVGTANIINDTLVIGGARTSLSSFDPGSDTVRYISDSNVRFSGIRITALSAEDLTLESIAWEQVGTAGAEDITGIEVLVNDVPYSTDVDGRHYTADFHGGISIKKGNTIDVYVRGNLTGTGANRSVKFDIRESGDIALGGNTYHFGVGAAAESNTAVSGNSVFITDTGDADGEEGTPFFSGSVVNIHGGETTTIGKN